MKIERRFFLTLFALTILSTPAQAGSSKQSFSFSSSEQGAKIKVMKSKRLSHQLLDSCITPCVLELKPKKMGRIYVSHPNYRPQVLEKSQYLSEDTSRNSSIKISVDLGVSHQEKRKIIVEKFEIEMQKALTSGDAKAKAWMRTPPSFPPIGLQNGRSAWCRVSFDIAPSGKVINADAFDCSENGFKSTTERGVNQWLYVPPIRNGSFIPALNVVKTIEFDFNDEKGRRIPPLKPKP